MKKLILITASILFLVASCTLEKRIYSNGFNVQWHASNGISKKDKNDKFMAMQDELAVSIIHSSANKNLLLADVNIIPVEEVSGVNVNDVASISETPSFNEVKLLNHEIKEMATTKVQQIEKNQFVLKVSKQEMKPIKKGMIQHQKSDDVPVILLYILCFVIPCVAVGLVTDWDVSKVIVNILWTLLCGIPGIIHALIIVGRNV